MLYTALLLLLISSCCAAQQCYMSADNCNKPINQVVFLGTHNAGSTSGGCNWWNQPTIDHQLYHNSRFFDFDLCLGYADVVYNCHASSSYGIQYSNPFVESLDYIYNWLNRNPREIVFIHINRDGDGDGTKIAPQVAAMLQYYFSGDRGVKFAYYVDQHRATTGYPTFQQLIDRNERVVLFISWRIRAHLSGGGWYMSAEDRLKDSYSEIWMSSSCSQAIADARDKCSPGSDFQIVNVHGAFGLCNRDMASICNQIANEAWGACHAKRAKPNFILVDHIGLQSSSLAATVNWANSIALRTKNLVIDSEWPAELIRYHDTILNNVTNDHPYLFVACTTKTCTPALSKILSQALDVLSGKVNVILINATTSPYVLERLVDPGDPTSVHVTLPAAALLMPSRDLPRPYVNVTSHQSLVKYVEEQLKVLQEEETALLESYNKVHSSGTLYEKDNSGHDEL